MPAKSAKLTRYVSITDTCKTLGVSRETVTRLIRDGQLTAVNVGTKDRAAWRIDEDEIARFLARRRAR